VLVTVRFAGLFRRYTGERERDFDLPDAAGPADLLRMIGNEYGGRLPPGLFDAETGRFHRSVRLARVGSGTIGENDALSDGDEVIVIFALAGG